MTSQTELVKVTFPLETGAWHGYATERLWATKLVGNRYLLHNSPFYAMGVSLEDVVAAELDHEGQLVFRGVLQRGGHSTYRIIPAAPTDGKAFQEHWASIEALGCRYEGVRGKLLSIDVPPSANVHEVYRLLQVAEDSGVWGFEEAHCGHPLRETSDSTES